MARPRSLTCKRGHNLEENGEWYPKTIHGKSIQVRRCILCHNLRQVKWDREHRRRQSRKRLLAARTILLHRQNGVLDANDANR
jgi:hypothetical protein